MRQNALLRSGKGLSAAGAAREKVAHVSVVAPVAAAERADHSPSVTACAAPACI